VLDAETRAEVDAAMDQAALPDEPAFDPGEHTVAEVQAYLDSLTDDDERLRVLEAEEAGRARTTILNH
jgi:hypothetical protein